MKKTTLLAIFMIAAGSFLQAQTAMPANGNAGTNKANSGYTCANNNNVCGNFENNGRLNEHRGPARYRYARDSGNCRQTTSPGCSGKNNAMTGHRCNFKYSQSQ